MDLWISIGPNAAVLKSEIIGFQDGGYGCFHIMLRSSLAHPLIVDAEHADVARRNVMMAFGMEPATGDKAHVSTIVENRTERAVSAIKAILTKGPAPCGCGSPLCTYPNSAHCRRPL